MDIPQMFAEVERVQDIHRDILLKNVEQEKFDPKDDIIAKLTAWAEKDNETPERLMIDSIGADLTSLVAGLEANDATYYDELLANISNTAILLRIFSDYKAGLTDAQRT